MTANFAANQTRVEHLQEARLELRRRQTGEKTSIFPFPAASAGSRHLSTSLNHLAQPSEYGRLASAPLPENRSATASDKSDPLAPAKNDSFFTQTAVGTERRRKATTAEEEEEQQSIRVPEKKIPAVDKTLYIFRTPIDLMTGSRTVRCFTLEEREAYLKKLNETELTTYRFIKLVRLCKSSCGCRDATYYITFQAKKDGKAYSPCNFQALVRNSGRMHIEFCREEKKPKLTEGPGRHLSNDERLTSL